MSEIFKELGFNYLLLDLELPTAEKVLTLLLEYDTDKNLKVSKREFHKMVKDVAGKSKKGKKKYGGK